MTHANPLIKLVNVLGWATRERFEGPRLASIVRDIAPEFSAQQQLHLAATATAFDAGEPAFAVDHLRHAWSAK